MNYLGCIAGLGNPGKEYQGTRHNLGFAAIDALLELAARQGRVEQLGGAKFKCELWRMAPKEGTHWHLVAKPLTFMNLSGQCLRPLLHWHRLPADTLLVAHDELDFAPGTLRLKLGGGNAGHNGIASLIQELGTQAFYRLRIGTGRSTGETIHWVLSRPAPAERPLLEEAVQVAAKVLLDFAQGGEAAARACLQTANAGKAAQGTTKQD